MRRLSTVFIFICILVSATSGRRAFAQPFRHKGGPDIVNIKEIINLLRQDDYDLELLIGRADLVFPIMALMLSMPLYILLDWTGQRALDTTLGLVHKPEAAADEGCEFDAEGEVETPPAEDKGARKELAVEDRFESTMDFSQSYLESGLSIAVPAEGLE